MNEKKLKARDFITIGIFTAILWVVQMVIMYLGFLSPFIVAGYTVLIPIVTGIPMMLYYARIEKFGMLTITSVIVQFVKEYSPKSLRNREGFWYNRRKPPREAPSWKSTPKTPAAKQWLLT